MNKQSKVSMMLIATIAILAFVFTVHSATAQGILDELSVQGSSSTGGDATTIRGRLNGAVDFSVTGRFADVASVRTSNGTTIAQVTIRDLWNNNGVGPVTVRSKVQLADGRSRLFLSIAKSQAPFNGGQVRLVSGANSSILLDTDPIILR
jgi:hypothetical protein